MVENKQEPDTMRSIKSHRRSAKREEVLNRSPTQLYRLTGSESRSIGRIESRDLINTMATPSHLVSPRSDNQSSSSRSSKQFKESTKSPARSIFSYGRLPDLITEDKDRDRDKTASLKASNGPTPPEKISRLNKVLSSQKLIPRAPLPTASLKPVYPSNRNSS